MRLYLVELRACVLLLGLATELSFGATGGLMLGDPPTAPKNVSVFPRGPEYLLTGGFSVNTTNREEVRSFYNAVYRASDNVPINSTAVTASCVAGTNSADFKDAVARRINWYRAMAGLAANITLDPGFNASNQLAALIMSASTNLSHTPNNGGIWRCWSASGSNAANSSNIALGTDGPDAVAGYIQDAGTNNTAAGHRRWLLYPQTQVMGTGDIPEQGNFYAANAIWVFDGNFTNARPATRTKFIAWPPSGYVPVSAVFPRWSFSYTNANFVNATVTMTSNGVAMAIAKEAVQNGFGENTVVWAPVGLDTANFTTLWPFSGADTVYTVGINNVVVTNGAATAVSNFNYSVTVFDPAVPGAGYFPPVISGPAAPAVGQNNAYTFNSVSNASSYQWRYAQRASFNLVDGAEAGLSNWTTNTESDYQVITTAPVASGTHAFQLVHSQGNPQSLTLKYTLLPLTNAVLQFKSELEYAFANEVARVQISTNGGGSWFDVFTQVGSIPENSFSTKTIPLGVYAGTTLQLRFLYDLTTGSFYTGPPSIVGWHFDDITLTNAEQLLTPVTNSIAGTSFQFNPPLAGNYVLQARALIFTDFPLDWGPMKQVTAVTNTTPIIAITTIAVSNTQSRIDFTLQSGAASTYKLLTATQPYGSWSTDTVAVLTTNSPGSYRYTTTRNGNLRFYRIQTP